MITHSAFNIEVVSTRKSLLMTGETILTLLEDGKPVAWVKMTEAAAHRLAYMLLNADKKPVTLWEVKDESKE